MTAFRVTDDVAYQSSGVPLLIVGLMYPRRTQIQELMRDTKRRETTNTASPVQRDGSSIVNLTNEFRWLLPRFESFEPDRWYFGPCFLILRLCQSSTMVIFRRQTIQAVYACIIGQAAISAQLNLRPYRRRSDNQVALMAQWLVFIWCAVLLMHIITAIASLPPLVTGMICALSTAIVFAHSLRLALADTRGGKELGNDNVSLGTKYKRGDFILHNNQGERRSLSPFEFGLSYELSPEPAANDILAQEGFQCYRLSGRIWAHELSSSEVAVHFPAQKMITSWGSTTLVQPGHFLFMPYPYAGEIFVADRQVFFVNFSEVAARPATDQQGLVRSQADVLAHWKTHNKGVLYCKKTRVHAKRYSGDELAEASTHTTQCGEGSFIVRYADGRQHTLDALSFAARFDRTRPEQSNDSAITKEGFKLYTQVGNVWAYQLTAEDVSFFPAHTFVGKFGGTMAVETGDWLATPSSAANEVFSIPQHLFASTYRLHTPGERATSQNEALARWETVLKKDGSVYGHLPDGSMSVHAKRTTCDGIIGEHSATDNDDATIATVVGAADGQEPAQSTNDRDDDGARDISESPNIIPWDFIIRTLCVAETTPVSQTSSEAAPVASWIASSLCVAESESASSWPAQDGDGRGDEALEAALLEMNQELLRKDTATARNIDEAACLDKEISRILVKLKKEEG